jgi:hypothetical protein
MIPNEHFYKQFLFERAREWQREIEKQHLLSNLPRPHNGIMQLVLRSLGALLVALGTRLKQLEPSPEPTVCSCTGDCTVM